MVSLKTYKEYRNADRELMKKVTGATLTRKTLDESAKLLGIYSRGTIVCDSLNEMSMLFDFAIHDYRTQGKNLVELYTEANGPANEIERELLVSHAAACTSLFWVVATFRSRGSLLLRDVLKETDDIELMDVNLSKTATRDLLLFLRPISLAGFSMTSGFIFAFPGDLLPHLLTGYQRHPRKSEPSDSAQRRFLYFARESRNYGLETSLE